MVNYLTAIFDYHNHIIPLRNKVNCPPIIYYLRGYDGMFRIPAALVVLIDYMNILIFVKMKVIYPTKLIY